MAVNYDQMSIYKTGKSAYETQVKNAKDADVARRSQERSSMALAGASIGLTASGGQWWGALVGAVGGWVTGGFTARINAHQEQDKALADINQKVVENYASAGGVQEKRNTNILDAKYFVKNTQSSFVNTYGSKTYSMLEHTIYNLLGGDAYQVSNALSNLSTDTIIGQIESRLYKQNYIEGSGNGQFDSSTIDNLYTSYVSLEDLGADYVGAIYQSVINSDTELGSAYGDIVESEYLARESNKLSLEETVANNRQKFEELFLNMRSSNVSETQNVGEAQSESGASGIRASKSSRTNVRIAQMQQDVAKASYAILMKSYMQELESAVKSGNLTREQVGYQYASQRANLKRQIISGYDEAMNTWLHKTATYAQNIGQAEGETDAYVAQAKAGEQVITDNDGSVWSRNQYIYSSKDTV